MTSPLPVTPNFPVYGLGNTFRGSRWLDFWDSCGREQLWYVSLSHGDPVTRRPLLAVITDAKRPARPSDGNRLAVGSTGIEDATLGALLGLIHLAFPEDSSGERPPQFHTEIESLDKGGADLDHPGWQDVEITVLGEPRTFRRRALGGGWVAAADIGRVALGIYGYGMELTEHDLQPVSDLESYSAYETK